MEFMLKVPPVNFPHKISYDQLILLIGSCFTEHIGDSMQAYKFNVLQNPNGIIYNPVSICNNLLSYIEPQHYTEKDFFEINNTWQSWQHHSRCGGMDKNLVQDKVNQVQQQTHEFLSKADWLVLSFGTSFIYNLKDSEKDNSVIVANCHKAPADWFQKKLLTVAEMVTAMDNCMHQLFHFNPKLKIIFTVSPVRHIKDGLVENNLSKARLLEAVHHMVNKFDRLYYYPAYELVIDVLRDHRFYEQDLVHPNKQATSFVFDHFMETILSEDAAAIFHRVKELVAARKHRPFQPESIKHRQFLETYFAKTTTLQQDCPSLDLSAELNYFSTTGDTL